MAHAKITLIGMAKWLEDGGDDLFAQMTLPAGIDRQTFIDTVLMRGGEFEILFAEPSTMQYAIGAWSRKWQHTLQKWADVLAIDYNPLENYDRRESWSDAKTGSRKESGSSSDTAVTNGNSTNENQRAAYDSSSYSPVEKDINSSQNASSGASVTNAEGSNSESALHEGRTHGNIGVTTSQQMLEAEWEVAKLNVYENASELFLTELCIYTY